MKKKDLLKLSGAGDSTMIKFANNENIIIEVIQKYVSIDYKMDDLIEIIPDDSNSKRVERGIVLWLK